VHSNTWPDIWQSSAELCRALHDRAGGFDPAHVLDCSPRLRNASLRSHRPTVPSSPCPPPCSLHIPADSPVPSSGLSPSGPSAAARERNISETVTQSGGGSAASLHHRKAGCIGKAACTCPPAATAAVPEWKAVCLLLSCAAPTSLPLASAAARLPPPGFTLHRPADTTL
jgi:hypothetical protein